MSDIEEFELQCSSEIAAIAASEKFQNETRQWFETANSMKYSYHFNWLGLPIIQYPQDIVALQELVWRIKPDLIVETGIARGGSLALSASLLALLDVCYPDSGSREVVGVDIDIREHNLTAIKGHPLFDKYINMIEGSSVDAKIVDEISDIVAKHKTVLVLLDSNHTHAHVLEELRMYSKFVTKGSYVVVYDTVVEYLPAEACADRPWGPGDNPMTAVDEFLLTSTNFEIDTHFDDKNGISVAPRGYLRRNS